MEKILHLTLLKKWFDLIANGEKIDEYRDLKPYWEARLENRAYDEVHFRNGYARGAPFMRVECKGIKKEKTRYVISLGKILELKTI